MIFLATAMIANLATRARALLDDPSKCRCAKVMYRNRADGNHDVRLEGDLNCRLCRGHGRSVHCPGCGGAGMIPGSQICSACSGCGSVPA